MSVERRARRGRDRAAGRCRRRGGAAGRSRSAGRRGAAAPRGTVPRPRLSGCWPSIALSRLVLPEPFEPSTATNSPGATSRSSPLHSTRPPRVSSASRRVRIGSAASRQPSQAGGDRGDARSPARRRSRSPRGAARRPRRRRCPRPRRRRARHPSAVRRSAGCRRAASTSPSANSRACRAAPRAGTSVSSSTASLNAGGRAVDEPDRLEQVERHRLGDDDRRTGVRGASPRRRRSCRPAMPFSSAAAFASKTAACAGSSASSRLVDRLRRPCRRSGSRTRRAR